MRPNKAETAVHGYHRPGDMAVRMRKALARPWVGVRVCHLLLLWFLERRPLKCHMKTDFVRRNGQSEEIFCCNPHSVYFLPLIRLELIQHCKVFWMGTERPWQPCWSKYIFRILGFNETLKLHTKSNSFKFNFKLEGAYIGRGLWSEIMFCLQVDLDGLVAGRLMRVRS